MKGFLIFWSASAPLPPLFYRCQDILVAETTSATKLFSPGQPRLALTAVYGVDFPLSEYERMADLMSRIKGEAILSLNDHADIRRVFSRFQMDVAGINYTVGSGGKAVERQELIIYSWDKAADPVGLF